MPGQIAFFIENMQGGGAERVMLNLANHTASLGHKVDLVLVHPKGPYIPMVSSQVRVVDLKVRRFREVMPSLIRYFNREKPKAMLSALENANVAAVIARELTGSKTRLVLSEHTTPSQHYKHSPRQMWSSFTRWGGFFYRRADAVVGVSKSVAEDLIQTMRVPEEMVSTIYNPVITPDIAQLAMQPIDHPWLAKLDIPVILAVGSLRQLKDYPTLIRGFSYVRRARPARLIILGEGPERTNLQALINNSGLQDDVDLHGFVTNPYAYMKRASVFVLSSAWEGFGNVLVEAMALGTPVVSSDCPSGPAEILRHGKWGRLVPVGDSRALAEAILETLDNPIKPMPEAIERFKVDYGAMQYLKLLLS